ncbi:hypothetical protein BXQ17_09575 [Polaribacter sp. BM10]|uniref:hypothetical protein n=1 Tax=Polaribacter sp. BM10 TaxID=1529069 RepID=UPI00098BA7B4|nr:hypothetical protein [Polaribacter sp. BM10]AQS94296.1 hypothetical protein BXQ17_09575 [Polaribacter sp. BM10]
MKTLTLFFALIFIINTNQTFYSQNVNYQQTSITNDYMQDGTYKYCNDTCDVIVEIKNDVYTEFYPNNEFIKAKIQWINRKEYKLVITEIKKSDLPFGIGTIMKTKIVRKKGSTFYYESNLQGLSWSGKFELIN